MEEPSPGPSGHLHAGVEGRLALKVVHHDAVVAVDDVLVDALAAEVLQHFVDAVDAIQNGLQETHQHKHTLTAQKQTYKPAFKRYLSMNATSIHKVPLEIHIKHCLKRYAA